MFADHIPEVRWRGGYWRSKIKKKRRSVDKRIDLEMYGQAKQYTCQFNATVQHSPHKRDDHDS